MVDSAGFVNRFLNRTRPFESDLGLYMSHNIHITEYPGRCSKKEIQKHWDEVAAYEGRLEGSIGLGQNIRWLATPIYKSRDEAEKAIDRLDKGDYDQLAVKFKDEQNHRRWLVKIEYHT